MRSIDRPLRALAAVALVSAGLALSAPSAIAASDSNAVTFPGGPLTVYVGPRGQCQSSYLVNGTPAGNYYNGSNVVGDCGLFLAFPKAGAGQPAALQGKTFGFDGYAGPNLENVYTPVSQTEVTGGGTEASPYTQTTVFEVVDGESAHDALVTETTTYVNGAAQFTSTYNVKNTSGKKLYFRAIYAGDLYVNGSDVGTGLFLAGPPRFIGGQNTSSGVVGGFVEAAAPALPWSAFQEAYWATAFGEVSSGDNGIWHDVETSVEEPHAFNESVESMELDNGAGVEWDQLREAGLETGAEQAFTVINRTTIPGGLQINPANQTLTQGQTATISVTALDTAQNPYAGKTLHYTTAGANSATGTVTLNASGTGQISDLGANAGVDTVTMWLDLGGSGSQLPADPEGRAVVTFVPAPPAPNSSYKVQGIKANSDGTITITFVPTQGGTATLEVTVPTGSIARREALAAKSKKCKKGQIKIKGKCRPKTTVSGRLSATGVAGAPLTLTVKPSKKVKAALKKGRTVVLTAKLTYKSSLGGTPTVTTYHFKIKPKHKKHH